MGGGALSAIRNTQSRANEQVQQQDSCCVTSANEQGQVQTPPRVTDLNHTSAGQGPPAGLRHFFFTLRVNRHNARLEWIFGMRAQSGS